jgi:hypothetical protein
MNAILMLRQKKVLAEALFIEVVVWRVPQPLPGSAHRLKYRLALVSHGVCVLRYDNEAGKGDHRHLGEREMPYVFRGAEALIDDFLEDVARWRAER